MNEILSEAEAAELLDCEPATAQALARERRLPAVKIGRSWRFPRAALIEALNEQARQNLTPPEEPKPRAVKVKSVRPCLVGL